MSTSACFFSAKDENGNAITVQPGGYIDLRQASSDGNAAVALNGALPRINGEIQAVAQITVHCVDRGNTAFDFRLYAFGNAFKGGGPGWSISLGSTPQQSELDTIFTNCQVETSVDPDTGDTSHSTNIALSFQSGIRYIYLPALTYDNSVCVAQLLASAVDWTVALGDCLVADGRDLGGDLTGMPPAATPYPQDSTYLPPAEVNVIALEISDELYQSF